MLAVTIDSVAPVVIAVLGVGGIGGAIVAFVKVKPEANQIAVTASQGALIVQTGVIDTLNKENEQLRNRLEDLESKVALMGTLNERVSQLETELKKEREENKRLRARVSYLERRLREADITINGEEV